MTARTYRLEARDATGVFLGMGAAECALIGAGMISTILLRLAGVPLVMAAMPALAAVGLTRTRVGGQPLYHWIPLLVRWASTRLTGRRRWRGPLPLLPSARVTPRPREMPPVLRGIDIVEVPCGEVGAAAIRDRRSARLTVVIPVASTDFAGTDVGVQEALLAGWGAALASHADAGSPVVQVGWSHSTRPGALTDHTAWAGTLSTETDAGLDETYEALVEEVRSLAVAHDTVVWLTVSGAEVGGRGKPIDRALDQLPIALDSLIGCLGDAGLDVGDPLGVAGLWRLLRRRCDPFSAPSNPDGSGLAERTGLLGAHNGRPLAVDTQWNDLRIDGAWHRTYWVESWPRRPMPAGWLAGFLGSLGSATMTTVHRPIDPGRSQRRIESQLVKLSAHRARKEEKARRITESDRRTEEAAEELEAELTSGYAEMLYLGLVTVAAPTEDQLDDRAHEVEQAGRAAQLGLRVLHGRQDVAWAASLPFGLTEPGALELVGL